MIIFFHLPQREQAQLRQSELEHSVQLKKLDIKLKQLEREKDRLNLVSSTTRKIDYEYGLEIKKVKDLPKGDMSQYIANLSFKVKNTSISDLSTDFIVIDAFVRNLSVAKDANEIATIEPVGVAPDFFYSEIKPELGFKIDEWYWIMRQPFISPSMSISAQEQLEKRFVKVEDITPGGTGVGTWKSNESISVGKEYIVIGKKGDYISFVINVCFNGCTKGSDRWWFPYTKLLPSD